MEYVTGQVKNLRKLRIGTRKSSLAMAQTELVAGELKRLMPELETEIIPQVTTGDKILGKSLVEFGGKGVFVSEFETALQSGAIDVAVHSAKDLPAKLAKGLEILAVLKRGDPRDVLVTVKGRRIENRPMVIGTSSLRRQVQICGRMDARCVLLRGNVNTRLAKLEEGCYDGILLAAAGLKRLGLERDERFSFEYLPEKEFIPAGGQAIIAVEGRLGSKWSGLLGRVNDSDAMRCLSAEREVLSLLQAGCNEAVGVFSWFEQKDFFISLMKDTPEGVVRREIRGDIENFHEMARQLTRGLEPR